MKSSHLCVNGVLFSVLMVFCSLCGQTLIKFQRPYIDVGGFIGGTQLSVCFRF